MSFYTYMHTRNDTNETFYIGKGHGKRAFWKHGRNHYWTNIVKKHGYTVHVLAQWEKEADAFEHEKFLISCFRKINKDLVNRTDGGDGPTGQKFSNEQRQKMRVIWKEKYLQGNARYRKFLKNNIRYFVRIIILKGIVQLVGFWAFIMKEN